jgi:hypothetical protein
LRSVEQLERRLFAGSMLSPAGDRFAFPTFPDINASDSDREVNASGSGATAVRRAAAATPLPTDALRAPARAPSRSGGASNSAPRIEDFSNDSAVSLGGAISGIGGETSIPSGRAPLASIASMGGVGTAQHLGAPVSPPAASNDEATPLVRDLEGSQSRRAPVRTPMRDSGSADDAASRLFTTSSFGGEDDPIVVAPAEGLDGWTVFESGGSPSGKGTATADGGDLVLNEGDSFLVGIEKQLSIGSSPTSLEFDYSPPAFDAVEDNAMRDAFEIALVDAQGKSLVPTIGTGRDSFLNVTGGLSTPLLKASGVTTTVDSETGNVHVSVDIPTTAAGKSARFVMRLVNNDADGVSDSNTTVRLIGTGAEEEGPAFVVPGSPETMTTLTFTWDSTETTYPNEVGFFVVDAASGRVGDLAPSTSNGYFRAALSSASRRIIFNRGDGPGTVTQFSVPGGTKLFQYVVQNSTTEQALAANPAGNQSSYPKVYFQSADANPDTQEHFSVDTSVPGVTEVSIEYGADSPFDDLVYTIRSDVPTAPSALTASPVSGQPTQIALSWSDNSSNESGFKVERSTDGKNFTDITPTPLAANTTTYTATGLTSGTSYFFRVRAYNANGNSTYSNSASLPPGYAIGHWAMEEDSGTVVGDSGGDRIVNNGTRKNGSSTATSGNGPTWIEPSPGYGALDFDGVDDSVEIPDSNNLDLTTNFTVAAWIKLEDVENEDYMRIVSKKYEGDDDSGYELIYTHGPDQLIFAGAGFDEYASSDVSLDTNWHHVAATIDGTRVQLYVDGEPVETDDQIAPIVSNDEPLHIGSRGDGTGDFFEGSIDDVRIYNRRLSDAELGALASDPGATKFFVVDGTGNKTYRYDTVGNAINNSSLDGSTSSVRGAASNVAGDKLWTVDAAGVVRSYTASGTLNGTWTASDVETPTGIATDGTDVWIVDDDSDSVLRYAGAATRTSGTISSTSSFDLASENAHPSDIVAVDGKFWVSDDSADAVFVYNGSEGLLRRWQLDSNNGDPSGITLDPSVGIAPSSRYTVVVTATDLSNNEMDPMTWTFTTSSEDPQSIWDDSTVPADPAHDDEDAVEVGVKFRSNSAGYVTGLRYYKGETNIGTHVGHLWSSTGTLLATATFTTEAATGWQTVHFAEPVAIAANTTYVASYFAPFGHYAANVGYFANSGATSGTLTALADGVDGSNGVYAYGGGFPEDSFEATNYWVDVLFEKAVADLTAPIITSQSPAPQQGDARINAPITVTFDKPIDDASLSFVLRNSSNTVVTATATYDEATQTATLTPAAPLTMGATYSVTISATGTNDLEMTEQSWSFTTGTATIWADTAVPTTPMESDFDPVEVGVKFRSTTAGYVTGIRFYEGYGAYGTHVGHLWSAGGTQLASVTFENESGTGWQTAYFSSPVAISANTTYVISYYAPVGRYAVDENYFSSSGVTTGPLTALASGVDGNNGVYVYGSGGGFPNQSYNSGNYWVDPIFSTADTTGPAVISRTPSAGIADISTRTQVAVTFNEAIDPENSTITVLDAAGHEVPGAVTYDPLTHTLAITPEQSHDFLWVVDRVDKLIYRYALGRDQRSETLAALDALPLDPANTNPEGIADPPPSSGSLTVNVSPGESIKSGSSIVVGGQAKGPAPVSSIIVNGRGVDAIDAGGNFFSAQQIQSGDNTFHVVATIGEDTVSKDVTVSSADEGQLDFSLISDVSPQISAEYARTSLNSRSKVVYADVTAHNIGNRSLRGQMLAVVTNISDATVELRDADGVTPSGMPYYLVPAPDNQLEPDDSTQQLSLAFYNPNQIHFTYDLVFLANDDRRPQFTTVPVVRARAGNAYSYRFRAVDPDGDALSYSLLSGPSGMTISSVDSAGYATLSWSGAVAGDHAVTLLAAPTASGLTQSAEQMFIVSVSNSTENSSPYFTSSPVRTAHVGGQYSYLATARDPDGDVIHYSKVSGPAALTVDQTTGQVSWSGSTLKGGDYVAVIRAVDVDSAGELSSGTTQELRIHVADDPNHAPIISSDAITTVPKGASYFYDVDAEDADKDSVEYSLVTTPSSGTMTIDSESGLISWTAPSPSSTTSYPVVVRVEDGRGGADEQAFNVVVSVNGEIHGRKTEQGTGAALPSTSVSTHPITLTDLDTDSNDAVGIDYQSTSDSVIVSVNYLSTSLDSFEQILANGEHAVFGPTDPEAGLPVHGLGDEVKIAVVPPGNAGGFTTGDVFTGTGRAGEILHLFSDGTVDGAYDDPYYTPWITLGSGSRYMRGGLCFDTTGVFGGDLIVVTDNCRVWRIDSQKNATLLANLEGMFTPVTTHLEGVTVIPNDPSRYGDLAGKILTGAEDQAKVFAVGYDTSHNVTVDQYLIHVDVEDIDIIPEGANFFGAMFGDEEHPGRILGAPAADFEGMAGDILLTQGDGAGRLANGPGLSTPSDLFRLVWDFDTEAPQVIPVELGVDSFVPTHWEHVTFANSGISQIAPSPAPRLSNFVIYADLDDSGTRDEDEPFAVTDNEGNYAIRDLPPGTYSIREEARAGWVQAAPAEGAAHVVTIGTSQIVEHIDFLNAATEASTNRPPVFDSTAPVVATTGNLLRYGARAHDPDGDALTYDLAVAPAGMTVNPTSGVVSWKPSNPGSYNVILRARDGTGASGVQPFTIEVGVPNHRPQIISVPTAPSLVGHTYSAQVTAIDADPGDDLAFSVVSSPSDSGITINSTTGVLNWSPSATATRNVTVTVTDGSLSTPRLLCPRPFPLGAILRLKSITFHRRPSPLVRHSIGPQT